MSRRRALAAIGAASLGACVGEGRLKAAYADTAIDRGDGWPVARPESVGLDPAGLRAAYEWFFRDDTIPAAVSMLVARDGKLVAEGYCRDPAVDPERPAHIVSATKTVTALAFGRALADGVFSGEDEGLRVALGPLDSDDRKQSILCRHLLTMRSGILFDNQDFSYDVEYDAYRNAADYVLARPMYALPGERFYYRDADPFLLAAAIERKTGTRLDRFVGDRVLSAMGIASPRWMHAKDGTTHGAYGLFLKPRQLAKVGQLLLQRGRWDARELVPAAWIDAMTSPQVTNADLERGVPPSGNGGKGLAYGYLTWLDPSRRMVFPAGHGGQYAFALADERLVVTLTADPDSTGNAAIGLDDAFRLVDMVRRAVRA